MVVAGASVVVGAGAVPGDAAAAVTGTTFITLLAGGGLLAPPEEPMTTGGAAVSGALVVTGGAAVSGALVVTGTAVVEGALVVTGAAVVEGAAQLPFMSVAVSASPTSSPFAGRQYDSAGMPPSTKLETLELPEITAMADLTGSGFPCASVFRRFSRKEYCVVLPEPFGYFNSLWPQ